MRRVYFSDVALGFLDDEQPELGLSSPPVTCWARVKWLQVRGVTHVDRSSVTDVLGRKCYPCSRLLTGNACSSPAGLGAQVERNTHPPPPSPRDPPAATSPRTSRISRASPTSRRGCNAIVLGFGASASALGKLTPQYRPRARRRHEVPGLALTGPLQKPEVQLGLRP
jgi:hypothetical protein